MLSVDDLVDQVVQALDKGKHLENTYIIFSSDNGFHLGKYDTLQNSKSYYPQVTISCVGKCNHLMLQSHQQSMIS